MALPPLPPASANSRLDSTRWGRSRLIGGIAAVIVTAILVSIPLEYLEAMLYDFRMRWRPNPSPSGAIEMVVIKPSTISRLKGRPHYQDLNELIQKLESGSPKAIVYLRNLAPFADADAQELESFQRNTRLGSSQDRSLLAQNLSHLPNFYLQTEEMRQEGEAHALKLAAPFEKVRVVPGPRTVDRNILAKDGVTRRTLINYQNQPLLHWQVASLFNPQIRDVKKIRGLFELFDSEQVQIDFLRPGSFPVVSFEDVLDGKVDPSHFREKLVLIGEDTGAELREYVATPFDRDLNLPVVELHANMFDSLIRNSAPRQGPIWLDWLFTFLISTITIFVVMGSRPARGILIILGTGTGFLLLGYLSFWWIGLKIPMAHAVGAIFLCYYFLIPYRLIVENRISWEYYQKHQLLQQVEELKTNFISMMSHDLKTPIARIQGMIDVISKDRTVLSPSQQEAVDTIKASASDLLGFINSILNYARIESQGVVLHKQAKDLNQLLEEVIRKHEFLAKVKTMKIHRDLEPLFSLAVDPDLMKQVFSNLLENAIKYSPDHSEVHVRSREINGQIVIDFTDQGQGIPEEDLNHLFMKFFRSKNAKASPIKGSGLGLYLSKYFVELHGGQVIVTSTLGKGSTFTVQLPLEGP